MLHCNGTVCQSLNENKSLLLLLLLNRLSTSPVMADLSLAANSLTLCGWLVFRSDDMSHRDSTASVAGWTVTSSSAAFHLSCPSWHSIPCHAEGPCLCLLPSASVLLQNICWCFDDRANPNCCPIVWYSLALQTHCCIFALLRLPVVWYCLCKVKSFPSHEADRAALISVSLALSQTPAYTVRHGYGASVLRGVPVYFPAFAGTHCAYPRRDGQAELTWVAGYIPRWLTRPQMVTHPSTNRARCRPMC